MTAATNLFDQTLKTIARNHADLFLRLAFPDLKNELRGTPQNVELALPVQPVDFVSGFAGARCGNCQPQF